MLNVVWKWLFGKKTFRLQTFTWYIPAPPARQTGYREKNFDKVIYHVINKGYRIISVHTQAHAQPEHSGMWVIFLLQALNSHADKLDLESSLDELEDAHTSRDYIMDQE